MTKNKYIIAIPARLNSKRLPRKVIELIGKETMISLVMRQCLNIPKIEKVFLCTDHKLISNEAKGLPIEVILKSGQFSSGTDRIYNSMSEIYKKLVHNYIDLKDLYIINVQADQPFINKDLISEFINKIEEMSNPEVLTSYYKKKYQITKETSDNVKIVVSKRNNRVLYFSRSVIPYMKNNDFTQEKNLNEFNLKYHIGVYAYRFDILQSWAKIPNSQLEDCESLEQLRWLDYDIPVYAFEHGSQVLSIDNINQLEYARSLISN